jgi:hypothetical protein
MVRRTCLPRRLPAHGRLALVCGLLALALGHPAAASAAERYAATEPRGLGDCSSLDNPCRLPTAINGAQDGDTVIVYSDGVASYADGPISISKRIVVRASDPRWHPDVWDPITITGAATLRDLDLTVLERDGPPAVELRGRGAVVDSVRIEAGASRGIQIDPGARATVRDTVVEAVDTNAVAMNIEGDAVLRNVTVSSSGPGSLPLVVSQPDAQHSVHVDVLSSIFHGPNADIFQRAAPGASGGCVLSIDYSNFDWAQPSFGTDFRPGSHNQTAPPVVSWRWGYGVRESPTVDAGAVDDLSGSTDVDSHPRVLGDAPDIGAGERVPPPIISTGEASELYPHGVTLQGTVIPNGERASYEFDYGTTSAYGHTSIRRATVDPGLDVHHVALSLTNLEPSTTYHYRLTSWNGDQAYGPDRTFTTPPATPFNIGQAGAGARLDRAGLHDYVVVPTSYEPPLYKPAFSGVITGWSTYVGDDPDAVAQLVVVDAERTRVNGRSALRRQLVHNSLNTFTESPGIPIAAGDFIALGLPAGSSTYAFYDSDTPFWDSAAYLDLGSLLINHSEYGRLNLSAIVEPDQDRDGYGDLSQDRCPTDPSTNGSCPPAKPNTGDHPPTLVAVVPNGTGTAPPRVKLTIRCGAVACAGVARLEVRLHRRHTVVGARRFKVGSDSRGSIAIGLNSTGRHLLAKYGVLHVLPTIAFTGSHRHAIHAKRVTLRAR